MTPVQPFLVPLSVIDHAALIECPFSLNRNRYIRIFQNLNKFILASDTRTFPFKLLPCYRNNSYVHEVA